MARLPNYRRMEGFTLLEIMISMLLLTVILTASVSLLFLNIKGWDALTSDTELALDRTLINQRIHSIIGNLSPLMWQTKEGRRLAFQGEEKRLQFISKAPQQHLGGGLFEYLLQEETDDHGGTALVLYYAPFLPDRTAFRLPEAGSRRVLFSDIEGALFSYYGAIQAGQQDDWMQQWESDLDRLPALISLTFADGDDHSTAGKQLIPLMTSKVWNR